MNEDTVLKTLDLPYGQRYAWFGDANVLVLSADLQTAEEREDAISEAILHWRRHFIRAVPGEPNRAEEQDLFEAMPVHDTMPLPDRIFPIAH